MHCLRPARWLARPIATSLAALALHQAPISLALWLPPLS